MMPGTNDGSLESVRYESVPCNLCGGENPEELFERGDLALGMPGSFRVVRCRSCGLGYLDPRPVQADIGVFYPPTYEIHRPGPDPEKAGRYLRWRQDFCQDRRRRLVLKHRQSGRLLDVGCAEGHFLRLMRERGFQVEGVELVEEVARRARERFGLDVRHGPLERIPIASGSLDVITFFDVLEHLHDPTAALREAARLLCEDGLLVLSVPLSDSLDARLFGRCWIGYELPRHLYFFSTETLGAMLSRAGFRVVEVRVLFGSDFVFAEQVRFLLRALGAPRIVYGGASYALRSRPWRWTLSPLFELTRLTKVSTLRTLVCERERR